MNTLTLKLPPALDAALAAASERAQLTKSELVRRAVIAYLVPGGPHDGAAAAPSALALAGDLVGCLAGGPADLASNPRHLEGFGQA
jgi:Ribbon-helix-helix protein, copG family